MNFDPSSFLWRKVFAICPVCKKPIHGKDLELNRLQTADHWPVSITCLHGGDHPITLWIDARYSVRDVELS